MLISIAFIVMLSGFSRRWSSWRMGRRENRPGDWAGLLRYILGHEKILKDRKPGIAHLMLFWGFMVPLLIIILAQFDFNIPPIPARILSLLTDTVGMGLLAAILFFLVRRLRSTDPRGPKRALFPLFILLIILITGFLAEGSRLSITNPEFTRASPLGWLISMGLPPSPILMQMMIRFHFIAVLLFIAVLPFTALRHLAVAPLNILYRRKGSRGELRAASMDEAPVGANSVKDFSWKQLLDAEACVSCGRCEESCPAFIAGKPLSPRKVIQNILEQMASVRRNNVKGIQPPIPPLESLITGDEIWSCTTCMACVEVCPVFIEPMDKIIDMRRYQVMGKGLFPMEARSLIRNLEIYNDVQGKGMAHRVDWALNRHVPLIYSKGLNPEILLWVGCSGAFHPRYQEVSRAMVHILKTAGVPFGILGKDELCCGDPARRMGEEGLFFDLARKNIRRLKKYGIKKILTLCPHCFNTLKNEYPRLNGNSQVREKVDLEVVHASEYVMNLIKNKRISPKYPIDKRIAVHDPCYLGRINDLYGPPREIIKALPQTRLKELERHHANGFCCGGGGGGMWLHDHLGRRMNMIRAEEVLETGVDLLGTACPYCLTMLDDGIKSLEREKPPKVLDVIEIVAASIG